MLRLVPAALFSLGVLAAAGLPERAAAETLTSALASAYSFNPQINSARAGTRAVDESVPLAKSLLRPTVSADFSVTARSVWAPELGMAGGGGTERTTTTSGSLGLGIQQFIFRGFRTRNAIREAEADVRASRELQQNTVQNVLFDAAEAYMNVLRDIAVLDVRRRNVAFLQEQVRAVQDRFNVGETTRTDVAQTRARLSLAMSEVSFAEANLSASRAIFRQVIGRDPNGLRPGNILSKLIPNSLAAAVAAGQSEHPAILAAIYQADAEAFVVKQVEGELLPTVSIDGGLSRDFGINNDSFSNSASIIGRVSVPIYQGGALSARVRQAKELLGQRRIEIDLNRDQVRAAVVSAWGQLEASGDAIAAATAQVEASNIAIAGVQEEQSVGQRTTLDVLNAQQELLNARVNLIIAERDRVVASYALVSAMGRLTAERLGLPVEVYRPEQHYLEVRDKWYGLRTPDGR